MGEFAEALQLAAFNGITEGDMTDMMKAVMAKAKEGDVRAIKFVLDFVGAGAPAQPQVQVHLHKTKRTSKATQEHTAPPRPEPAKADPPQAVPAAPGVTVLRRLAARVLLADGVTPGPALAAVLEVGPDELRHVLACDWFRQAAGGYELTPAGRGACG